MVVTTSFDRRNQPTTTWRVGRRSELSTAACDLGRMRSERHIAKHAPIAAVRRGKSTRLWTRIAAEATEAARA
jgi:hypothetical protein